MKKTKFRRLAAMAASLLCCLIFTVPAYAQSSEQIGRASCRERVYVLV